MLFYLLPYSSTSYVFYFVLMFFQHDLRGWGWRWHSHRAEKWHTLGRKATSSGPKSDVRKCCMGQNATLKCYNMGYTVILYISASFCSVMYCPFVDCRLPFHRLMRTYTSNGSHLQLVWEHLNLVEWLNKKVLHCLLSTKMLLSGNYWTYIFFWGKLVIFVIYTMYH